MFQLCSVKSRAQLDAIHLVLAYTTILFTCACIGRTRGNRIWSRSVKEAYFFSHIPPAPTSVQPGTMMITTSPTPTLLSRISIERLRGGIRKINSLTGLSASNSAASTPSVVSKPLPAPIVELPRASMAEVHRSQSHRVPVPFQAPVVLEPEPSVPSPVPTRYYDWWDPEISANETPLRTFTRRLSTISEKLERSGTAKTASSTKCGTRPSSSSSTLVKKRSEPSPSSSKGKQGKRDSKRDSDQSFIVFFPCEYSSFLVVDWDVHHSYLSPHRAYICSPVVPCLRCWETPQITLTWLISLGEDFSSSRAVTPISGAARTRDVTRWAFANLGGRRRLSASG